MARKALVAAGVFADFGPTAEPLNSALGVPLGCYAYNGNGNTNSGDTRLNSYQGSEADWSRDLADMVWFAPYGG